MSTSTTTQTDHSVRLAAAEDHHIPSAATDSKFQSVARGDRAGTLKLRGIPTFSDAHAKRQWVREHMAAAFRFFGKQGYGEGVSGHISVRGELAPVSMTLEKQEDID